LLSKKLLGQALFYIENKNGIVLFIRNYTFETCKANCRRHCKKERRSNLSTGMDSSRPRDLLGFKNLTGYILTPPLRSSPFKKGTVLHRHPICATGLFAHNSPLILTGVSKGRGVKIKEMRCTNIVFVQKEQFVLSSSPFKKGEYLCLEEILPHPFYLNPSASLVPF
jgi:hypothetical protein